MNKPVFNTLQLLLIYSVIWVILIVAQICLINYYQANNNFYEQHIWYDTIVCNVLQATCILTLWYPAKYYRNVLNFPLLLLYQTLFFIISSAIWLGLGFQISYLLLLQHPSYPEYFLTILPLRIVFGLLIYIVFVLAYYLLLSHNELNKQKQNVEEKIINSSPAPIEKLTRIIVKKKSEFHCINVNQIHYIEANGDYVLIYTDSDRYLKDQTMKYWEMHLPNDSFVRIHRSFIVNIEVISKIELYEKEIYKVHLKNGDILKASYSGYKLLKQKMRL